MHIWVEIDTKAIKHNLKQFRKLIGPKRLLMPVVKANAYGHGIVEVAKICDQSGEVDRICVVNDDEALQLIKSGIKKPIMILSFYELEEKKLKILIKNKIIFPIYCVDQITALNQAGDRAKTKIRVHLKLDTGAARVGVLPSDALTTAKKITAQKYLQLEGLWSHFASSESDADYTKKQHEIFQNIAQKIEGSDIKIPIKHMACSAASILFPLEKYNAVRVGLSMYGLHASPKTRPKITLKPALSWLTSIIQVKTLPKGAKIGYGGTYIAKTPITLAILPVGYWDGYDRGLSNKAKVLIKGKLCPIRGRICMNLCMVDVSNVKNVKAGDMATLIGKQGNTHVTAEELAELANTINYEIVDRINPLIPRIYK